MYSRNSGQGQSSQSGQSYPSAYWANRQQRDQDRQYQRPDANVTDIYLTDGCVCMNVGNDYSNAEVYYGATRTVYTNTNTR